jgi:hypothetical protein
MKDVQQIIAQLPPTDASSILQALATSDEALASRIAEMALVRLRQVDMEEVAVILYDELDALEVEEVWDRAGRTRHGYVELGEAADQMIAAVLAPLLDDLTRYQKLGLGAEANRMCEGLLLGFYRFQHESRSEFKNWAPDAPMIFAEAVVDAWKSGSPNKNDFKALRAFITEELGGWGANLL